MALHVYTSIINSNMISAGDGLTEFEVLCLQAAEQCGEMVAVMALAADGGFNYYDVCFQTGMVIHALSSYHLYGFTQDGVDMSLVTPFTDK